MNRTTTYLLALVQLLAAGVAQTTDLKPRLRQLKYQINNSTDMTWKSRLKSFNYTLSNLSFKVGALDFPDGFEPEKTVPLATPTEPTPARLLQSTPSYPTSLNLTAKYPECSSLRTISDQGNCASCWALSAAAAISDNACIAAQREGRVFDPSLSAQDMLECCPNCFFDASSRCSNGYVFFAYKWIVETGSVSGGQFGDRHFCKNYYLPPGSEALVSPPTCQLTCNNPIYQKPYAEDKFRAKNFSFNRGVNSMVTDLNRYGSLTIVIPIYDDFFTYSSGVYRRYSTKGMGTHSIRVIGYGKDPLLGDYWLCANTWGPNWGEAGFFRIRKGANECNIEANFYFVAQV